MPPPAGTRLSLMGTPGEAPRVLMLARAQRQRFLNEVAS